ncbi:MAG: type II toxin-antitoxin system RelE/ParE family toxin [Xanthobacteraceae bacterium]
MGRRAAKPASWPRLRNSRRSALALNVAKALNDLSPLKSVGLHKLKGERRDQWAMSVNARWRICFEFRRGDAYEVEIVDYHKG